MSEVGVLALPKSLIQRSLVQRVCGAMLAMAAVAVAAPAHADQWGVQLAAGTADHHVKKVDLGVVWDPGLTWWQMGAWHFTLVAEGHVAFWHTDEGNINSNIQEFGATPVFRIQGDYGWFKPYVEAGVGVRLITHPHISTTYTMSSAFQFADMVGVGAKFGAKEHYQAGFRFQHLSNASIKEPNPGINFTQLYVEYNF